MGEGNEILTRREAMQQLEEEMLNSLEEPEDRELPEDPGRRRALD